MKRRLGLVSNFLDTRPDTTGLEGTRIIDVAYGAEWMHGTSIRVFVLHRLVRFQFENREQSITIPKSQFIAGSLFTEHKTDLLFVLTP